MVVSWQARAGDSTEEMCRHSGMQASLELSKIPVYDGALDCLKMGIESSLQPANVRLRRAVANHEEAG